MPVLVKMPKWGLMMKAGTVTEWLRAEGDAVSAGEPLFVVETDKAINDVEAPGDGVLRRIVAGAGTEVTVSGPVGVICAGDDPPQHTITGCLDVVDRLVGLDDEQRLAGRDRVAFGPKPFGHRPGLHHQTPLRHLHQDRHGARRRLED
jgi:pyruvate/2-oxoglutarate dehydrogenase complex dihydrolipoamide acyltransferase (E2) component